MDLADLPDEMCSIVMKYCQFATVLQCRRMSTRLDKIAKGYGLNRVPAVSIRVGALEWENTLIRKIQKVQEENMYMIYQSWYKFDVKSYGYNLKPLNDDKNYLILSVEIYLKEKDPSLAKYEKRQFICRRLTENENKYQAIDKVLEKLRCIGSFKITGESYDKDFDDCICRNRTALRLAKHVVIDCCIPPNDPNSFRMATAYPNLACIHVRNTSRHEDFAPEKLFAHFDGGIGLSEESEPRRPENLGDGFLYKWLNKLPRTVMLSNYRNNFTLPVFQKLLLKLQDSGIANRKYNFGILANENGELEAMENFLDEHEISYFRGRVKRTSCFFDIWWKTRSRIYVEFDTEDIFLSMN